jgi:hypothetical protein
MTIKCISILRFRCFDRGLRRLTLAALTPLCFMTGSTAHAAAAPVAARGAAMVPSAPLPRGIHATRDGRYTRDLCDHGKAHFCMSRALLPEGWTPDRPVPRLPMGGSGGGGSTPVGMAPSDILAAYGIPSNATAGGKIVAVLDSPDTHAASDLAAYRKAYGIPALPKCVGMPTGSLPACFAHVGENGGAPSGRDDGADADSETALDIEMISAACPDCSILLVEVGGSLGDVEDADFVTGVATATSLGAVAISISIGGVEDGDPQGNYYTTPGHLVLAAAGDWGYDNVDMGEGAATPSYPASAPDVLAVGGTTLFNNGSSYDEAVWNDGTFSTASTGQDVTTSGCSTEFAVPTWQASALSGSGCSMRANADVSAAANYASAGQLTYIAIYEQGWTQVEGTSASSPMMAGILTRLGLAETISKDLGWVYTNAAVFHDLGGAAYPVDVSGSDTDAQNPSSCGQLCTAGPGWDGPSGVGTPDGAKLAALGTLVATQSSPDAGVDGGTGTGSGGSTGSGADAGTGTGTGSPTGTTSTSTGPLSTTPTQSSSMADSTCTSGRDSASTDASVATGTSLKDAGSGSAGGCSVSTVRRDGCRGIAWFALGLLAFAGRRHTRVRFTRARGGDTSSRPFLRRV